MITAETYDKDMDQLRSKIGTLQKDLSEIIGTIGQLSGHGVEDLREEAAAGADALLHQSQRMQAALSSISAALSPSLAARAAARSLRALLALPIACNNRP